VGAALEFRILGPLEARLDEEAVNLGGARQRGVLALLLVNAGTAVSSDRLIDELWGEDPPRDAGAALQAHISRLRKLLEPDHGGEPRVIVTTSAGYVIRVGPGELDLLRFEELVAAGRRQLDAGEADAAGKALREALALWRGRPLANLETEAFAQQPIRDLDELWLDGLEARIDADLRCGRHADLTRELAAVARRHPLRERLRAQLMLALYRSGRQAEALESYAELRRTLVEERGLEPGRELRELQEAILRQDPALDASARTRPAVRSARRRRRWLAGLAGAGAAAAAIVLVVGQGGDAVPPASSSRGFVAVVSPSSGAIQARVAVGATPSAVAVGDGRVWVLNADDQTLSRIDPRTRATDTFATGATPTDLAAGQDAVWVGSGGRVRRVQAPGLVATSLARLDADTHAPRATIPLPRARATVTDAVTDHIAVGAGGVWVIGPDGRVLRIDPRTNRVMAAISGVRARAIAADAASVWTLADDGRVSRIDAATNALVGRGRIDATAVASIAAGRGGAWVSAPDDEALWRIVPGRGDRLVMSTVRVATGTTDLAYGAGALWAVNPLRGTLARIDGNAVRVSAIGGFPRAVAVGAGAVWVAASAADAASASPVGAGVGALPMSFCQRPFYGGDQPAQRLVVSDLPLQGGLRLSSQQMADAMAFVLRRRGFHAGRWRVAYQSCDDAIAATRLPDSDKCAANARAYGAARDVVAVVGPLNSDCAVAAIPELGRAAQPLAMVSPLASYVGLTRPAAGAPPGQLRSLYPSGRRTFLRVFPTDQHQIAALAVLAKRLDRSRVYVLDDGDDEYGRLAATQFERSARGLGLTVVGRSAWDPAKRSQRAMAERVARARPEAVFVGGRLDTGAAAVVRALRDRLGGRLAILAPEGVTPLSSLLADAGPGAAGTFVALAGVIDAEGFGAASTRFVRSLSAALGGQRPEPSAVYAAQAMEVVLDAIGRSDGTRSSVLDELFRTRMRDGLVGSVSFDRNGDVRDSPVTILRVEPGRRSVSDVPDAAVYGVVRVPTDVLR
jgi:DNA-binding SARP family transcriptional activator/ABC-type branched-subunit amino acid transport system substrate-binding protein